MNTEIPQGATHKSALGTYHKYVNGALSRWNIYYSRWELSLYDFKSIKLTPLGPQTYTVKKDGKEIASFVTEADAIAYADWRSEPQFTVERGAL